MKRPDDARPILSAPQDAPPPDVSPAQPASPAGPQLTLPARFYADPAMYEAARERLFMKCWHYVCHETNIPETGDYYAFTLLDQDLFVVRDRQGGLRCFYNVCQHRGHALVSETGRTQLLVCPYHAWTYELDGRLRGAPGSTRTPGFDRACIHLTPLRIEVFLGFVFVNFDAAAPSMEESYPGVADAARAVCPGIDQRVFAHEHEAAERCNWLVAVENYNECYHCGHVHISFSNGVIDPESYDIQPFGGGRALKHSAMGAKGETTWYETAGAVYASFYLFPLFSLQIYPGGVVNSYYWRPEGPTDTTVHRGWFTDDGVVDDQLQAVIDLDRDTTFAEDLALVESVQRGLSSRGYRPGPLVISPTGGIASEHSIAALHGWLREAIG